MAKKQVREMAVDNVNFFEFDLPKLLRFTKTLYAKYESERQKRIAIEVDRNKINMFLKIAKVQLTDNEADRVNKRNMAEEFEEQVSHQDQQFRLQRLKFIIEDAKTVDNMRSETRDIVADLSRTHNEVANEQHWQNKQLKEKMKAHNVQMRKRMRHIQLNNVVLLKNRLNKAYAHTARAIQVMEDNRLDLFRETEKTHQVEMHRYHLWYRGDLLKTIADHSEDVDKIHETYRIKIEKQLVLIGQLKYELEENIKKNLKVNQRILIMKQKNINLGNIVAQLLEQIKVLEEKMVRFDDCHKLNDNFFVQIKRYKGIVKEKDREILLLKNEIGKMMEGFQKYDDYFINVLLDVQSMIVYNYLNQIKFSTNVLTIQAGLHCLALVYPA